MVMDAFVVDLRECVVAAVAAVVAAVGGDGDGRP